MTFWTNAGFEPKRAFRFKVTMLGVEPFYVKKITKPKFTLQEAEHKFLNRSYFFPGHVTWDPVTVTFVDDNNGSTLAQVTQQLVTANYQDIRGGSSLSPGTANGLKTVQKKALVDGTVDGSAASATLATPESGDGLFALIEQIDSTDSTVVESIKLYNPWIKSITPSELSYDVEDLSSYDIEIRYDWAQMNGPLSPE